MPSSSAFIMTTCLARAIARMTTSAANSIVPVTSRIASIPLALQRSIGSSVIARWPRAMQSSSSSTQRTCVTLLSPDSA